MAKKKAATKAAATKTPKTVKAATTSEKPRGFKQMKLVVVPSGKKFVAGLKNNGKLVFTSEPMSTEGHAKNFAARLAVWLKKPDFIDAQAV
jgi:hypothetical protein